MYLLVRDQIRLSGGGDVVGLDYTAVLSVLELYEIKNSKKMFEDILIQFNTEREEVKKKNSEK